MTSVKEREPDSGTPSPSQGSDISLEVTARNDLAAGMFEVSVTIDNQSKGSSYVLTTPRNLAFRKTG
ncbi:hypothetical protein ABIA99_001102 [Bradyrhizobium sp. LB12.1]|uniref:hypothetical protein n=1 Tax=Bradyrhizobium sp. LB12.1 TaxID=3156327 RepID=UPI0033925DE4